LQSRGGGFNREERREVGWDFKDEVEDIKEMSDDKIINFVDI
jgi:hypothetical protein